MATRSSRSCASARPRWTSGPGRSGGAVRCSRSNRRCSTSSSISSDTVTRWSPRSSSSTPSGAHGSCPSQRSRHGSRRPGTRWATTAATSTSSAPTTDVGTGSSPSSSGRTGAGTPASREDRLLLERDAELDELGAAFAAATTGSSGTIALVSGEAGIGKSRLVRAFTAGVRGSARVLAGACDDLLTPRSLGPFHDMAPTAGPDVAAALAAMDREGLLSALSRLLGDDRPTVFVVEDAHWADDATLDVLRWLLRRLVDHRGLVVLTYRPTDVELGHPLQRLLGAVPPRSRTASSCPPSGPGPWPRWCAPRARRRCPGALARVTGGNPFFVTEVLADAGADMPGSVVDAVMARLHALPVDTVKALLICSVIPGTFDVGFAAALLGDVQVLDKAERRGMLIADGEGIRFRHELARRAIEGSLTDLLRLSYHRRVLAQLVALDAPAPRLVHHAAGARDVDKLLEHGVRAAREAVATGARRQAAEHFAVVLAARRPVRARRRGPAAGRLCLRAVPPQRPGDRRGRGPGGAAARRGGGRPAGARRGARHAGPGRASVRPVGRRRVRYGAAGDRAAGRRPASGAGGHRLREPGERPRPGRPARGGRRVDRAGASSRPPRRTQGSRVAVPDVPGDVQGVARRPRRRGRPPRGHRAGRGDGCLGLRRPRLPQHGGHAVPAGPVGGGAALDRPRGDRLGGGGVLLRPRSRSLDARWPQPLSRPLGRGRGGAAGAHHRERTEGSLVAAPRAPRPVARPARRPGGGPGAGPGRGGHRRPRRSAAAAHRPGRARRARLVDRRR